MSLDQFKCGGEDRAFRAVSDLAQSSWALSSLVLICGYIVIVSLFLILPAMIDEETFQELGREDALIENIGAAAFLGASAIFLGAFIASAGSGNKFLGYPTRRNLYFALLSALMFVCFGEEVSWGQRILGWETPALFENANLQNETNIHNLWLFHATDADGVRKSFFGLLLNMNRLFALFILAYAILIPLASRYWAQGARFIQFLGVPVPPLVIGGLFAAAFLSFRLSLLVYDADLTSPLNELKETVYATVYAMLAAHFLSVARQSGASRRPSSRDGAIAS